MEKLFFLVVFIVSISTVSQSQTYCPSTSERPWEEWIAGVSFGDMDNASGKFRAFNTAGYSDFTDRIAHVIVGDTTTFTITPGFSGASPNLGCQVWIDFNQNGTFEETESPFSSRIVSAVSVAFPISEDTPLGTTRMRVQLSPSPLPFDACQTFEKGEVEDYTIRFVQDSITQEVDTINLPDLTIHNIQTPLNFRTGEINRFDLALVNQKDIIAQDNFEVVFTLSTDDQPSEDDLRIGEILTGNLGFGTFPANAAVEIPTDFAEGDYFLIANIDAANTIEESDEENNMVVVGASVENVAVECPSGDVVLTTQAEVDAFQIECDTIFGSLIINGIDIDSLTPLSNISCVKGALIVEDTERLFTLSGLDNLNTIEDSILIEGNELLSEITALSNIQILKTIEINSNGRLKNLEGLNNITQLEHIRIFGNQELSNMSGLDNLSSVNGDFWIIGNDRLSNLDGLNKLELVAGTFTIQNSNLIDIKGLESLANTGDLRFVGTENLVDLSGLENMKTINGDLILNFSVSQSLKGLENLEFINGNLSIYGSGISEIDALKNLKTVTGYIEVFVCDNLKNVDGFSNITEVNAFLSLEFLSSLNNISGLRNLNKILGSLVIRSNDKLNDLTPLSNLRELSGNLNINRNPMLLSLDGIENISSIERRSVRIFNNDLLSDFCALAPVLRNASEEFTSGIRIENNAYNPTLEQLQDPNLCRQSPPTDCPTGDLTFNSQAALDTFQIECDTIFGDLNITGDDIINLSRLENIKVIKGTLSIESTMMLSDLTGLNNITRIEGSLILNNVPLVSNLDVFNSLEVIEGQLALVGTPNMEQINGLSNLRTLNSIAIVGAASLADLRGLEGITRLSDGIQIDASSLSSFEGLNNLVSIGRAFSMNGGGNITNFDALSNLQEVGGAIMLLGFNALTNIDGLSQITTVNGDLVLSGIPVLENIDGLTNLTQVKGSLVIQLSNQLSSLQPLANLTTIGGLFLTANQALTSLDGLENIVAIDGNMEFRITQNTLLNDFCAISNAFASETTAISAFNVSGNAYNPTLEQIQDQETCRFVVECPTGDVLLTSQAEVDAFPRGCMTINGSLTIDGADIIDLSPLQDVSYVGGSVNIIRNKSLINLEGLNSLTLVNDSLYIFDNDALIDISSLDQLMLVDEVIIREEDELTNVNGLEGISLVNRMKLDENLKLNDISGLSNLQYATDELWITGSPIADLRPLSNLEIVGDLSLQRLTVSDLTVFQDLSYVNSLIVLYLDNVTDFTGFENVKYINNFLYVDGGGFTDYRGLSNLKYVGGDVQLDNNRINTLEHLSNLKYVGGHLRFTNGLEVTSLQGLESIVEIGGGFVIVDAEKLENISALGNLRKVNSDLVIVECDELLDLSPLSNLASVRTLILRALPKVTSLSGLENIRLIRDAIITSNTSLTDFCALKPVLKSATNATLDIADNAYNPTREEILDDELCDGANVVFPDLTFQRVQTDLNFRRGRANSFNITIANIGEAAIEEDVTLSFVLSEDEIFSENDLSIGDVTLGRFGAGEFDYTATVDIPNNIALGNYFLVAVLDENNDITESDEANNSISTQVEVSSPSLAICNSRSNAPWEDWISLVQIGEQTNLSAKNPYIFFLNPVFDLPKEVDVPINLRASFSFFTYPEYFRVWMDLNQDNDFEASEIVFEGVLEPPMNGNGVSKILSGTLNIPATASDGRTRMRVIMSRNGFAGPCETIEFGEVEDYFVNIGSSNSAREVVDNRQLSATVPAVQAQIFPNPTSGTTNIQLLLEQNSPMQVDIIDVHGSVVKSITQEMIPKGIWEQQADLTALTSGIYWLRVQTNTVVQTYRVVKQ